MTIEPHPSEEDVLDAFAVEPDHGHSTLERYLRDYPDHAEALVDLAAELTRADVDDHANLLPAEQALINSAWRRYIGTGATAVVNPFANFSAAQLKKVAETLGVKRSVLTGFREHTVIAASVPVRFMRNLADAIGSDLQTLLLHLNNPPAFNLGRSFKSDGKPQVGKAVSFEQLLIDSETPEADRKRLMAEN